MDLSFTAVIKILLKNQQASIGFFTFYQGMVNTQYVDTTTPKELTSNALIKVNLNNEVDSNEGYKLSYATKFL